MASCDYSNSCGSLQPPAGRDLRALTHRRRDKAGWDTITLPPSVCVALSLCICTQIQKQPQHAAHTQHIIPHAEATRLSSFLYHLVTLWVDGVRLSSPTRWPHLKQSSAMSRMSLSTTPSSTLYKSLHLAAGRVETEAEHVSLTQGYTRVKEVTLSNTCVNAVISHMACSWFPFAFADILENFENSLQVLQTVRLPWLSPKTSTNGTSPENQFPWLCL